MLRAVPGASAVDMLPLDVRDLVYEVRGRPLIDGLSLHLTRPGVTAIMGPNGAGKSVLLRLLHGLLVPTRGTIEWNGQPLRRQVRQRQAMVFQRAVLLRRSVRDNLRFVLHRHSQAPAGRTQSLLEQVGLAHKANAPARGLSGGEQQRLAMARALAVNPQVLLLDEPTASLDPAAASAVEALVEDVRGSGTKLLLVTHDQGQARRLADDVVFLHQGQVAEHQEAASFFAAPTSRVARDYLAGRLVL